MTVEIIAGRKTGVRYAGAGEPAVLLHCSLAHSGAWGGVMAGLSDRLAMVAIDLPGHGATSFDPAVDIQDQACETTIAVLERFDAPAHLIGHSFGATVALRCAVERPDLVASVSMYEPVYFSLLAAGNPAAYAREMTDAEAFGKHLLAGEWQQAAEAFLDRWGSHGGLQVMPEAQQKYMLKTIPMILENTHSVIEDRVGPVTLANIGQLTMPCLLMEGARSPDSIHLLNDLLENALLNVQRRVFQTTGHMGPLSHAPEFARVVREFLFGDDA
ncbi:MAG: alpha/beta hydrolase [Rhodobacteraceae bacterium]|nr:MAG: alpha/beta hydrolase [Paracoccaceae bacterium]